MGVHRDVSEPGTPSDDFAAKKATGGKKKKDKETDTAA
jgi:hypothetical protein